MKDAQGNGGIAVHSTPVAPAIESERFGRKRVPKIAEELTVFIYCGYRRVGGYPAMAPCFQAPKVVNKVSMRDVGEVFFVQGNPLFNALDTTL